MAELNLDEFRRSYYLLALYAHQLIRNQDHMPWELWQSHVKDERFVDVVQDLLENNYVIGAVFDDGEGYAITDAGIALLWVYSEVLRKVWVENLGAEGENLINFLIANINAYADNARGVTEPASEEDSYAGSAFSQLA